MQEEYNESNFFSKTKGYASLENSKPGIYNIGEYFVLKQSFYVKRVWKNQVYWSFRCVRLRERRTLKLFII